MAKYKYTARTKEGELQTGFVESASQELAANILNSHNLYILSLESVETKSWLDGISKFLNRVKLTDLMIFTRQFATLLEANIPLGDAIANLYKQTHNQILKEAIYEISSDVSSGLSLSQAMERQSVFNEFYINMVRSAEITGRLDNALSFLANYLEKESMWQMKIRNAMIYPAFIVLMFVGVVVVLLTVVFPKLTPIFEESNVKLPLITKVLLNAGNFMLEWWWVIIIIAIFSVSVIINYLKSNEGKVVTSEILIKIPIFGGLFKKIYVARFADSVSILLKGGIPITQSIEITSHNIGNLVYRDILHEIAQRVRAGETFSSLISQNEYYFPSMVGQMLAIGEATGKLDDILLKISAFYTREVDNIINNLTELVQPLLIAAIGIFVGLLFAAILIPIYNLVQSFKV